MAFEIVSRQELRHNPSSAVTGGVERVRDASGRTAVVKHLRRPARDADLLVDPWGGSLDPRRWDWWRREADVYRDGPFRDGLRLAGLDLPAADVTLDGSGATLWLEDVDGRAGTSFALADHAAVAERVGRWQGRGGPPASWASTAFLRSYSTTRPAPWSLLDDDDDTWASTLIREAWPEGLRAGWQRLVAHRGALLVASEHLPRVPSHLDLWVANQIRRADGTVVLLDWAFAGDGSVGEDIGNHVPDAALDLFWPASRVGELDAVCFEAYLTGLRSAGWGGTTATARLGVVASCVKYAWLLPLMLGRAGDAEHRAYHEPVEALELYRQRGAVLTFLVGWLDEALGLLGLG